MHAPHSDALVFFGATGDLAHKQIFPSLQAMIRRGHLNVPVIGVAKAGWTLEQLRERARDSLATHGAAAGLSAMQIKAVLGHSNIATSARYVHLAGQRRAEGATVAAAAFTGKKKS